MEANQIRQNAQAEVDIGPIGVNADNNRHYKCRSGFYGILATLYLILLLYLPFTLEYEEPEGMNGEFKSDELNFTSWYVAMVVGTLLTIAANVLFFFYLHHE